MTPTRQPTRLKRAKPANLWRHAKVVDYALTEVNHKSKARSQRTHGALAPP